MRLPWLCPPQLTAPCAFHVKCRHKNKLPEVLHGFQCSFPPKNQLQTFKNQQVITSNSKRSTAVCLKTGAVSFTHRDAKDGKPRRMVIRQIGRASCRERG